MNTIKTNNLEVRALSVSDNLAALTAKVTSFVRFLFTTPMPSAQQSAAELQQLADEYEATQPSFASDLRAAAASLSR